MIIEKESDELEREEPPPSYADLINIDDALPDPPSLKAPFSHLPPPSASSSSTPLSSPSTPTPGASRPPVSPAASWSWWPTPLTAPQLQVRDTVRSLLLTLISNHLPSSQSAAAIGILDSCSTACAGYALPFAPLLHERFVEGHSMLYWVIVKRPTSDEQDENALLRSMISRAQPIPASTLDEIRAACLVSSDHRLFRRHIAPSTLR